jgi:isopropylmalate/homocitrate/citramalate synthase
MSNETIIMSDFAKASWAKYLARMPLPKMEHNWMISPESDANFRQELRDFCASAAPRVHHQDAIQEVG